MIDATIIIRCYNEETHIGRLLTGVAQQSHKGIEIVVVDSGSTDATLSIASQYPVRIIEIDKGEFSFGYSLNIGCKAANGEFLVFISAHCYPVYNDWISEILKPFKDERVACVYGKQRGNQTTKYSERQVFAHWFPDESNSNQGHPFCNNANAAIRRSVWEGNPYDETITGLEDLAWANKITAAGYRIAYSSEAQIVHVHDETPSQTLNRYRREAIAMKSIYPHEKFTFLNFLQMWLKNSLNDSRKALREHVFWKNIFSILQFRLMQFWGAYRGYAQRGIVSNSLRRKFYYPGEISNATNIEGPVKTDRVRIDYSVHRRDLDNE